MSYCHFRCIMYNVKVNFRRMNVVVNILDDVTTESDQSVDSAEGDQSRLKLSHFLFEFQDLVYRGQ